MTKTLIEALEPFAKDIQSTSVIFTDDESGSYFAKSQSMIIVNIEWYKSKPENFNIPETEDLKISHSGESTHIKIKFHNFLEAKRLMKFFGKNMRASKSYPPIHSFSFMFW